MRPTNASSSVDASACSRLSLRGWVSEQTWMFILILVAFMFFAIIVAFVAKQLIDWPPAVGCRDGFLHRRWCLVRDVSGCRRSYPFGRCCYCCWLGCYNIWTYSSVSPAGRCVGWCCFYKPSYTSSLSSEWRRLQSRAASHIPLAFGVYGSRLLSISFRSWCCVSTPSSYWDVEIVAWLYTADISGKCVWWTTATSSFSHASLLSCLAA